MVAVGSMVSPAYEEARVLESSGVSCTVINARFLNPLDAEAIVADVRRTGRLVTLEENVRTGGFGQQVREALDYCGARWDC